MSDSKVYKVPSANMAVLAEKFKKLARRAKKLGLPTPTFTEVAEPVRKEHRDSSTGVTKVWLEHQVEVDAGCTSVVVQGWTFIATIQHTEEGNIIRAIDGAKVPIKYRQVTQMCEHCNTNRNRKDTYILSKDGRTMQVGRNCLADFFGHDALMYAERAQYLADVDSLGESMESDFGGGRGPCYEALEQYLPYVYECIRLNGWMSRSRANELDAPGLATANLALDHLHPPKGSSSFEPLFSQLSPEAIQCANDAIEWASSLEGEDIHEYLHNIRTIARRMVCEPRDIGLAASIIPAFQRHLAKLRWKSLQEQRAQIAKHVGTVGDKIRLKVMVEKVITFYGSYGASYLHFMSDTDGNVFIWFASSQAFETGKEIVLQGTIKKHDERNGIKQNVVTRCAEVELKNYYTCVANEIHRFEAASEDEVKKLIRAKLSIKKLPTGTRIFEDAPQEEERIAV